LKGSISHIGKEGEKATTVAKGEIRVTGACKG